MTDHYIDIDMVQSYIAYLYTDFRWSNKGFLFHSQSFRDPKFWLVAEFSTIPDDYGDQVVRPLSSPTGASTDSPQSRASFPHPENHLGKCDDGW